MKSTQTNSQARCPACQKTLDGATDVEGDSTPSDGDLTICVYCNMLCVFNADLTLRTMRLTEFDQLDAGLQAKLAKYRTFVAAYDPLGKKIAPKK